MRFNPTNMYKVKDWESISIQSKKLLWSKKYTKLNGSIQPNSCLSLLIWPRINGQRTEVSLTPVMFFRMLSSQKCISVNTHTHTHTHTHTKTGDLPILITLYFRCRYIENIMYLNGWVLICMYKQSNTVYCLSHSRLSVILLSMLMILPSTLNMIRYLICGNN